MCISYRTFCCLVWCHAAQMAGYKEGRASSHQKNPPEGLSLGFVCMSHSDKKSKASVRIAEGHTRVLRERTREQ